MFFAYGAEETTYLKKKDKKLGEVIDRIGPIYREVESDVFTAVVRNIVGQQISSAAEATVWKRVLGMLGEVTPETICLCHRDRLQSCGMSFRKAEYIKGFAEKVYTGQFHLSALPNLSDEEVIRELKSLNGIGVWTAEMLMIFSLQRPDIISFGDLAIHRGMRMLYHHRKIDRNLFDKYARRYSPYGTVASFYLWAIAGGAIAEMKDYGIVQKRNTMTKFK